MSQPHPPAGEPTPATVAAADALAGLPLVWATPPGGARVSSATATTLRAALDLVLGEGPPQRPLSVTADDAALEVRCAVTNPDALVLSGGLLESVEGSLTRANGGRGEWTFRVPLAIPRAHFLMLAQGTLGLAVPWHAVLRVRLVPPGAIEHTAHREGAEVIPPFVSAADDIAERPVVLIALGLKRALLVADRLIWRMPADPIEGLDVAGGPSLTRAVRTADGEVFWVVDPADLLRDVEIAPLGPTTVAAPPAPPAPAPPRRPPSAAEPLAEPRGRPVFQLVELRPDQVEPLGSESSLEAGAPLPPTPAQAPMPAPGEMAPAVAPATSPAPEPAKATAPAPTPAEMPAAAPAVAPAPPTQAPRAAGAPPRPVSPRRALIAEDSIVGRIFLARLLERRGFLVDTVSSAKDLEAALKIGSWTLVLAGVDLPDSPRAEHLRRFPSARPSAWVALVRDRDDEALARAVGVRSLRAPFEAEALDRLLPTLDLPGA